MNFGEVRHSRAVLIIFFLAVLVGAGVLTWYVRYAHDRNEVDAAATELLANSEATPYATLEGEAFSFAPYRGKVRVVNVWASWSPYTQHELPVLNRIATDYENRGVVTIAINRKEQRDRALAYLTTQAMQPKVVYVIDETDAFYRSVGGYAMPETIIFDADGNLMWHHRGEITYELVQTEIEKLIVNN